MDPSYKHLDKDTLNELLEVYRRNLGVLEVQAAKHGSAYVPVVIVNSIREAKKNIDEIEKELYKYEPNTVTEKQSPKILVIDDDATFREEIVSMLSDEDFVIVEASNGIEGLKLAEAEQPDILLLDIEMPEMDGYTVLAQIVEKRIRTRVLIISAYDNRVNVLIRAGACDYISKMDVNKAVLKTAIQRSLLLDYTVDVILDNPIKIINPLIERLELSYRRETAIKESYKGLVKSFDLLFSIIRGEVSDNVAEILEDIERTIIEAPKDIVSEYISFFEKIKPDMNKEAHRLHRNMLLIRKIISDLRTLNLSTEEYAELTKNLDDTVKKALYMSNRLAHYTAAI